MENITIIVGNGMDIQLGLPTTYREFYLWMRINHDKVDNLFLPEKGIDIEDISVEWSDFENKFVDIINTCFYILNEDEQKLKEIEIEEVDYYKNYMNKHFKDTTTNEKLSIKVVQEFYCFIKYFEDFLKDIERFYIDSPNFKEKINNICNDFLNITKHFKNNNDFTTMLKDEFSNIYTKHLSFVTLNYTSIIDSVSNNLAQNFKVLINNNGFSFQQSNLSPLHLHGKIRKNDDDDNFIIGTYSLDVFNKYFMKSRQKYLFSKKDHIERESGRSEYKNLNKILSGHHLIIVYGLSLGDSDKILMQKVVEKLLNSKSILIVYGFDNEYKEMGNAFRSNLFKEYLFPKILKFGEYSNEDIKRLEEKIYIVPIDEIKNLISPSNKLLDGETQSKILPSGYKGKVGEEVKFDNMTYVNMSNN